MSDMISHNVQTRKRKPNRDADSPLKLVRIYTDGSSQGNGRLNRHMSGAYAYVILEYNHGQDVIVHEEVTMLGHATNNQSELTAAIVGVKKAVELRPGCDYQLYSDSEYVTKGFNQWMCKWSIKRWRTYEDRPVKNVELWKELLALSQQHPTITFHYIEGHSGDKWNQYVDKLAQRRSDPSSRFP